MDYLQCDVFVVGRRNQIMADVEGTRDQWAPRIRGNSHVRDRVFLRTNQRPRGVSLGASPIRRLQRLLLVIVRVLYTGCFVTCGTHFGS